MAMQVMEREANTAQVNLLLNASFNFGHCPYIIRRYGLIGLMHTGVLNITAPQQMFGETFSRSFQC